MSNHDVAPSMLVVDDDATFRSWLAAALRERGFDVREAEGCQRAIELAAADTPEYVVVDLRLPDGSGLEVVRDLRRLDASTRIVVLTSYGSIATALDAVRLGATHYLTKPTDVDEILAAYARAGASSGAFADVPADPLSLARVEWEHINRVLADSGGNVSEAARRLGMHRRSLQRKLAKFPTRR